MVNRKQVLCHRVDVQHELEDLATKENGKSAPAKLLLGQKVVSVVSDGTVYPLVPCARNADPTNIDVFHQDCAAGSVTVATGETYTADVIIGADGIRSTLRASVVGPTYVAEPSNHSAYRMLVPVEKIRDHEDIMATGVMDDRITVVDGGERRIITYPCRFGTLLNFVCCLRKSPPIPEDGTFPERS